MKSVKVYQCAFCYVQEMPGQKPLHCRGCGNTDFWKHDSIGEAGRWNILRMLERAGKIEQLERQVRFPLMAARHLDGKLIAVKVGDYIADFRYLENGESVIEDYKGGVLDPLASWKLRHMEAAGLPVKLTG